VTAEQVASGGRIGRPDSLVDQKKYDLHGSDSIQYQNQDQCVLYCFCSVRCVHVCPYDRLLRHL